MKLSALSAIAIGFALFLGSAFDLKADSFANIAVSDDATIAGAAFFGRIQADPLDTSTMTHGMALNVTQTTEEVFGTYFVPAHYENNFVTVEDWGWSLPGGYDQPQYEWQVTGQDYYPAVYDENGNLVQEERYENRYEWVYVGTIYVPTDPQWIITGTHTENQPIWVEDAQEPYSETRHNAPVIHQKATRSDANWVWDVPTAEGSSRPIMRLLDGGLLMLKADGSADMALGPDSLIYTLGSKTARVRADSVTYTTQVNNEGTLEESESEVRPELVRLTRTETTDGTTTVGLTQIAAKSAAFGGVVTVQGATSLQALSATSGDFSGSLAVTGALTVGGKAVLTQGVGDAAYLTAQQIGAAYVSNQTAAGLLSQTDAATTYLGKTEAATTYLSKTDADNLYAPQESLEGLLTAQSAAITYLTKTQAAATYAQAAQTVTPTALTTTLADYQRKDQAVVTDQNATFKANIILEGERDATVTAPDDPATTRKIVPKGGQVMLVPEQGDISMGDFRAGALPVATP